VCALPLDTTRCGTRPSEIAFSAEIGFRLLFALFRFGCVVKKLLKNEHGASADNAHGNRVQNNRRIGGFAEDSVKRELCKTLWISFGEVADKRRIASGKADLASQRTRPCKSLEMRTLARDVVFVVIGTTRYCGELLTPGGPRRSLSPIKTTQ
jgi:hypothetical protein